MKSLKLLFILLVFFGMMINAEAKTKLKVYPKIGIVVSTVHKPKIYVHSGIRYHFAGGIWYKPHGRKYVVCRAPRGVRVKVLPRGHRLVVVKGRKLYHYNGVWYKKRSRGYVVVHI